MPIYVFPQELDRYVATATRGEFALDFEILQPIGMKIMDDRFYYREGFLHTPFKDVDYSERKAPGVARLTGPGGLDERVGNTILFPYIIDLKQGTADAEAKRLGEKLCRAAGENYLQRHEGACHAIMYLADDMVNSIDLLKNAPHAVYLKKIWDRFIDDFLGID